jgi:hypothetical protein
VVVRGGRDATTAPAASAEIYNAPF